jgi:hypothetical protein
VASLSDLLQQPSSEDQLVPKSARPHQPRHVLQGQYCKGLARAPAIGRAGIAGGRGAAICQTPAPAGRMLPMKVHGTPTRTIWPVAGADAVEIIDQTALPHSYRVLRLDSLDDVAQAIRSMQVRGAPLIGVSAAYGVALALARRADDATLARCPAGRWPRRVRRRSTCTGRWPACKPACCRCHPRRVPRPRGSRQAGLPTRTCSSVAGSATHGLQRAALVSSGCAGGSRS